jgi:hypothetical protein
MLLSPEPSMDPAGSTSHSGQADMEPTEATKGGALAVRQAASPGLQQNRCSEPGGDRDRLASDARPLDTEI